VCHCCHVFVASGDSDAVGCASVSNRGDLKSFSSSFASSDFVTSELKQQQDNDCNSYSPLLDPSSPAKSSGKTLVYLWGFCDNSTIVATFWKAVNNKYCTVRKLHYKTKN
jgi:hypothetical protein